MSLSKNDFCDKCQKIRVSLGGGRLAGQALDEMRGNPIAPMVYRAMLIDLKSNGGCSKCIRLLENAT